MDRIQQPHVNPVAGPQQNGAFDPHAGSPQYVQDTQQMYTPHPLDRNALGDSKTNPTSASGTRVAGPALYPTANNHAPSSTNIITTTASTNRRTLSDTIVTLCGAWQSGQMTDESWLLCIEYYLRINDILRAY